MWLWTKWMLGWASLSLSVKPEKNWVAFPKDTFCKYFLGLCRKGRGRVLEFVFTRPKAVKSRMDKHLGVCIPQSGYCTPESERTPAIVRPCLCNTVLLQEVQTDERKRFQNSSFNNCFDRNDPNRNLLLFPLCLTYLAFRRQASSRGLGFSRQELEAKASPATCWERRASGMPLDVCTPELSPCRLVVLDHWTTFQLHPCREQDAGQVQQHEGHAECWGGLLHDPALSCLYCNPADRAQARRYSSFPISQEFRILEKCSRDTLPLRCK